MTTTQCCQCHKLGLFARECFQDGAGGESRGSDLGPHGGVCGGGGLGGRMDYKPPITKKCYKCNLTGNFPRDCKEAEDRCYRCNGTGHISKNCQHKPDEIARGKRRRAASATSCATSRRTAPTAGGNDPVTNVFYRFNERGHIA
ncbi:hypothetical protein HPB48_000410 [Haemaphysalis longicornis]|uniref:CCHC-type domain-containing protein n=1 Tax=Haemaphysalis longicornis TaxID=44386 RepID=A0A9J6FNZ9_HAELO|nr:hypothetical protein HPB48_000410 [Haemaphysalis longicornis]